MAEQYGTNMSEGNVVGQLMKFAVPFMISNLVQSLYSVADMFIVGRYAGTYSMSGVNIGGQVTFIITNIVFGLCTGGTVLIAQYRGLGNQEGLKKTIATLMTLMVWASLIMTVVMLALKVPILHLMQTPKESFDEANNYLMVTVIGILFILGYNVFSAILRGMGDSRRPFYFVSIACVTNIILDIWFVGPLDMKAYGAALATIISQALSMLLCVVYLRRHNFPFDFKPSSFRIDKELLRKIFAIGTPSAVQSGVTSFSFAIITVLVNMIGGVEASAAVGVVSKFNGFAIMPAVAMSASISTMSAQNIGAGKWDRALECCKVGTIIAAAISTVIFVIAQTFPEAVLGFFNDDPVMIAYGVKYMRSFCFDYLLVPYVFCLNGLFVGAGHTTFSLINNMLSALILRIPVSLIFSMVLGLELFGVGLGAPAATLGSLVLIIWFYRSGRWRINKVLG